MDLRRLVDSYFDIRELAKPDTNEAMLFLTSEIGELADVIVSPQKKWVRNDKTKEDIKNHIDYIADEVGDVLMMLTVVAGTFNLDPVTCMQEKMTRKITEMYDENQKTG
jgi:NTP pyrophosphatase (non-canonical NTP hydrolase)